MRLYLLQIHNDGNAAKGGVFDELYHFADFADLCAEYRNKINYYKAKGLKMCGIEEPTLDECDNEAHGSFEFKSDDDSGSRVLARVTDLDVED